MFPSFMKVNTMSKTFGLIILVSSFVLAALALASGGVGSFDTPNSAFLGIVVGFVVAQLFRGYS